MLWGMSWDGCTDLHVITNGTLAAVRYLDEILRATVRLYTGVVSNGLFLAQDNAWPSCSPDLNPIERLRDRCIGVTPPGTTTDCLEVH